jgi:hypothetical protein
MGDNATEMTYISAGKERNEIRTVGCLFLKTSDPKSFGLLSTVIHACRPTPKMKMRDGKLEAAVYQHLDKTDMKLYRLIVNFPQRPKRIVYSNFLTVLHARRPKFEVQDGRSQTGSLLYLCS